MGQMIIAGVNYGLVALSAVFTFVVCAIVLAPLVLMLVGFIANILSAGGKKRG